VCHGVFSAIPPAVSWHVFFVSKSCCDISDRVGGLRLDSQGVFFPHLAARNYDLNNGAKPNARPALKMYYLLFANFFFPSNNCSISFTQSVSFKLHRKIQQAVSPKLQQELDFLVPAVTAVQPLFLNVWWGYQTQKKKIGLTGSIT